MTREFKFRAWDEKTKTLFNVSIIDFSKKSDRPLMQFTGLKDKSGKEIYEGDKMTYTVSCGSTDGLVRIDKRKGKHIFHALVVFENGQFCGKKINGDGSLSYGFPVSVLLNEVVEGNIYE